MAEKEYIEREAILYTVEEIMSDYNIYHQHRAIKKRIKRLPAADVAPVVHCKDCEYNNECSVQDFGEMHKNDFCSHGKRKELDNG